MRGRALLCVFVAALVALGALRLAPALPGNARTYIERKYSGWSGVLQAWVYEGDGCGGRGLLGWLQSGAAAFEKAYPGVYIEFEQVAADKILFLNSSARKPDLFFFPAGLLDIPAGLLPVSDAKVRDELRGLGGGYALPVAMGTYAIAANGMAVDDTLGIPEDSAAAKYSAAAVCLWTEAADVPEIELQYDLDLGLEALSAVRPDAYARFKNGELRYLTASQREIWKLLQLREEGKGPDWTLQVSGEYGYSDRFLYAAIPAGDAEDAQARADLAEEFLQNLLEDDMQRRLAVYSAFPVTEVWAYSSRSALAPMEAGLRQGKLIAPRCFSEYWLCDFEAIVRDFTDMSISRDEAIRRLMLAGLDMRM